MKKIATLILVVFIVGLSCHEASTSSQLNAESLAELSGAYHFFMMLSPAADGSPRYLYADYAAHLHAWVVKKGRSELLWETASLGSPVTSLVVGDFENNGNEEIMVSTARGRIIVYDAVSFERLHENFLEPFRTIDCLTAANVDEDPQMEIIFVAENRLNIYDAVSAALEWRSQDTFQATELGVADLDDDPQLEIVLNTGTIIDSRFFNLEPYSRKGGQTFGRRLKFMDMNGDGHPEIFGEEPGFALKIYDAYAQREVW
ncbi:MAG: hypothetical protein JSW50_15210 [Candidatus Latescibacterota bacterium]|nr:MAG: hypothetical protein JSW50_15210 [Candidatus Latescibacterota bacterium]